MKRGLMGGILAGAIGISGSVLAQQPTEQHPMGDQPQQQQQQGKYKTQLPATATSKDVIAKLEDYRKKVERLEQVSTSESKKVRTELQNDVKGMRDKIDELLDQAMKMDQVQPDEVQKIRNDLQKHFADLDKKYQESVAKLSVPNRQKLETAG